MSQVLEELFRVDTDGGIAARHPPQQIHSALVGPSTEAQLNTITEDLTPVACVQLKDARFEFDSSFVSPKVSTEMVLLGKLHRENQSAPLSIFGHADPVGNDDYNKTLSGRRAQAIYALLTRRTDLWEELFKNPFGGDDWGTKAIQVMLTALGHYDGPIDGIIGNKTREAVKAFQSSPAGAGLVVDGDPGKQTRPPLYKAYMDAICIDEQRQPFQIDAQQGFLAGGVDADGKGDYQGCSEFNPILLFSQAENAAFQASPDKAERNRENQPNRRVLMFLFRPGTRVTLERWPCPRAKEGVADCQKRFFSDGEQRRGFGPERREYEQSQNTFACRFYDRIAVKSPCERRSQPVFLKVRILFDIRLSKNDLPDRFRLVSGDGSYDRTLDRGQAIVFDQNNLQLIFTEVVGNQLYSLFQEWSLEATLPVFLNVPFLSLQDFGVAVAAPNRPTVQKGTPPAPPAPISSNTLVRDDPADHSQGKVAFNPDPHLEDVGLA